jgi:hypothetical protein
VELAAFCTVFKLLDEGNEGMRESKFWGGGKAVDKFRGL